MTKKTQAFNLILYSFSLGLASLVPFLMLPILSKELTVAEFGTLMLIEASILFMIPFVSLKIEAGIGVEYFKLSTRGFKVYVFNALLLSLISFLFVFGLLSLFYKEISSLLGLSSHYILMLPIFALLRVMGSVLLTIYRTKQQAMPYFYLSVSQTIIDLSLSYLMVVVLKEGIDGRLWAVYLAFGALSLWAASYFYRNGYFRYRVFKYFKAIFLFSLPLIPHALAAVFIVMSDRYFLAYFYGEEMVGFYAAAYQIAALMLLAATVLNQVWAPQLYKWLKEGAFFRAKRYSLLITTVLVFLTVVIFMLEDVLYSFLIDERFYESKPFFIWLLLGFLFQGLYFVVTNYLFFYRKTALLSAITVSMALLNLLLNYVMIKEFAEMGVAYATFITWFLLFLIILYFVWRYRREWSVT